MQRITWDYPEIVQWEIPMPDRRSLVIEQDFMASTRQDHEQHFLVAHPDAEEYWRVVNSYSVEDLFRDRRIYAGKVRLYRAFGMISVMGKLFKINPSYPEDFDKDALCIMLWCAHIFRVTKVMSTGRPIRTDPPDSIVGKLGVYILSFGTRSETTGRLTRESVHLTRWIPSSPRTCRDWVVLLQRRARRAARARRALAFAMAIHVRLGAGSAAACLGSDLVGVVCGLL